MDLNFQQLLLFKILSVSCLSVAIPSMLVFTYISGLDCGCLADADSSESFRGKRIS